MKSKGQKNIRLCHLIISLDVGGMENGIINISNRLDQHGILPYILCIRRKGSMADRLKEDIPVFFLGYESGFHWPGIFRIVYFLQRNHINIFHTHNRTSLIWGGIASMLCPHMVWIHTEHGNSKFSGRLESILIRRARALLCVSKNLIKELQQNYRFPSAKVTVILNGVDPDLFSPVAKTHSVHHELGVSKSWKLFTVVGRLEPRKNQQLAIRALYQGIQRITNFGSLSAKGQLPKLGLVLIGDGTDRKNLQELVNKLGIRKHVFFLGYRNDLPNILPQMDCLMLPSAWGEGMANVILEAASCGLPVLASDIPGNDQIVQNEKTGLLIAPNDVDAWANAIVRIANFSKERAAMKDAGRRMVLDHFSLGSMVRNYTEFYYKAHSKFQANKRQ